VTQFGILPPARLGLCVVMATVGMVYTSAHEPGEDDANTLRPDATIERRVETAQEDRYDLALIADQRADIIVDQRGTGLAVHVLDPVGTPIADFDGDINGRGEQHLDIVASTTGRYTFIIAPLDGVPVPPRSSYAIRIAGYRAADEIDRAMAASRKLRAAAVRLRSEGKLADARTMFERAAKLADDAHAPPAYVGPLLGEMAGAAMALREYRDAEPTFHRALVAYEQAFGAEHPASALLRSRLAVLYQNTSQFLKAETAIQSALAVMEKTVGTEHPWFVRCLVPLANLRDDMGDLDKAEEINQRGLGILERLQQTDSVLYADLLNNLGNVFREKRDYARAEDLFSRSLAIGEKVHGPDSEYVASELQNLGVAAREQAHYVAAESYYGRALAIRERLVGPDHPDVAQLLNNLATISHARADDEHALELYFRALRIWKSSANPYHRGLLLAVGNIARTYASMGSINRAISYQRRTDALIERQLELNLVVGSERQKLAFARSMAERTDRTISLHLQQAPDNANAASLAALVLLQRKGRVLDAMTDTFAAVRQRVVDTDDRDLLDDLNAASAQLAKIALAGPEEKSLEDRQRKITELEGRIETVQDELSQHSAAFRAEMQPVTLEAVQAAMPEDAALIELAVFRPFDPKAASNDTAYGPPHYAAYVIRKDASPSGRDLGLVATIDAAVGSLREVLHNPRRQHVRAQARAVDDLILRPLRALVGDAKHLLISPDGELHLVPFDALIDEHWRYMIERYSIGYLTSGRDLLRMQGTRPSESSAAVIIANPLFGESSKPGIYFAPLANTAVEARAIKSLFPEATLLMGRRATKTTLQRVEAPRVLHIASHGFFLQDALPQASFLGTRAIGAAAQIENPLLRSGLALAGANLSRDSAGAGDDGILTALEASSLNLWGTKLVTLSACDTGVGEVRNGEGVYGLRRAFVLAGAETLVMSLWPVSDYVARETMTAYYTRLRAGLGRGEALRQAKLALLKRSDRRHPFYWASFIQSGEWASLDGRR
jgi:CHAT domain-containing protein/tetratricopeptide (TPR) repeat protein